MCYMLGFNDNPHEYSQGLDREEMLKEAEVKLAELLEIVAKLNMINPAVEEELGYDSNEREVVQFSKMAACKILKAAECYGYGGCILCGG
jgi:hypothetical protein